MHAKSEQQLKKFKHVAKTTKTTTATEEEEAADKPFNFCLLINTTNDFF